MGTAIYRQLPVISGVHHELSPFRKRCLLMKTMAISFMLIITTACSLSAYEEWSIPNLSAPTMLEPGALELLYQHQFLGRIIGKERPSNLYGIGEGADATIGLRSVVWRKAQVFVSYDSRQLFSQSHNEFTAGIAYAFFVPRLLLRLQAESEVYSYASYLTYPEKRITKTFLRGSVQSDPLLNRVVFLYNIGYSFDAKPPGMGIGCDVVVNDMVEVFGTFFPVLDKTEKPIPQPDVKNPFTFGIKLVTHGHQFFVYAGNATESGSRHLMQGTGDNHLRLGFLIKRLVTP